MIDLDESRLAKLAREMVMNVRNYKAVFADYGIDETDYYTIEKNEYYKKVKEHFSLEWNSALSTKDRVQIGSLAYIEQLMPVVTRRAIREKDPEPLVAVTKVCDFLQKLSGVGDPKSDRNIAEKFHIIINLGADTEEYIKSVSVNANDSEAIRTATAVPSIPST
jgi:hypothetical protein